MFNFVRNGVLHIDTLCESGFYFMLAIAIMTIQEECNYTFLTIQTVRKVLFSRKVKYHRLKLNITMVCTLKAI